MISCSSIAASLTVDEEIEAARSVGEQSISYEPSGK